ncbi:MAG: hypothetical protein ACR2P1_20805 [Pseudomonadales bacterium]
MTLVADTPHAPLAFSALTKLLKLGEMPMSSEAVAEAKPSSESAPRRKAWIYVLIAVLVVVSFSYLSLTKRKDNAANHDFYRVLYETSNEFKENLLRLDRMHKSCASPSTIRSLLPSYTETKREACYSPVKEGEKQAPVEGRVYSYQLDGQDLKIKGKVEDGYGDITVIEAMLNVEDILPLPKQGFSRYLFAGEKGNVLATAGGEKTISIVDLESINRAILGKKRGFWSSFKEQPVTAVHGNESRLPGYGSHVDMQLSYGEFRIFVFPFTLANPIEKEDCNKADTTTSCSIDKLYLVGLLPKQKLISGGSGPWNVSLVLVTLVSLMFMWTLMRVYLLPKSQSITPMYRGVTMVSGYGFYVVVIALVLAFMQMKALQMSKDAAAFDYAQKLYKELNVDLLKVFNGLNGYRDFYHALVSELNELSADVNKSPVPDAETLTDPLSSSPASAEFSNMIGTSLNSIASKSCNDVFAGLLPKYALTPYKIYPIEATHDKNQATAVLSLEDKLDESAERVLLHAHQIDSKKTPTLAFMAGNLEVALKPKHASYIRHGENNYLPSNIFTVFAFNEAGITNLPSIYYQEHNAPPRTADLSHRDYYKQVRDTNGWPLQLCPTAEENACHKCKFENVYIQRLLNINDGTRGTTISMPMFAPSGANIANNDELAAYTMGADVVLPSLSLAEPAPYDFTYMVVDRNSGDVLFHSDESRTLVENLFYSGNSKSNLSQWIKAGLDHYPELGGDIITGDYHGQAGRFVLIPAPVDAWAIVVFYPNDSLDSLMTNQFLFISVTFAVALLILTGLLFVCRHFMCTHTLKSRLSIPQKINGRMLIMIGSILLGATYCLFSIGLLFDLAKIYPRSAGIFSLLIPALGLLVLLLYLLLRDCTARFTDNNSSRRTATRSKGIKRPFTSAVALAALHVSYLHYAAPMPLKGLEFHYQQLNCNRFNYERQESIKMALSRFPNSITQRRIDPLKLLPIEPGLRRKLQREEERCKQHSSQTEPADSPNLSTLAGTTYLWQWINTYLLSTDLSSSTAMASEYELRRTMSKANFPIAIPIALNYDLNPAFWFLLLFFSCILLPAIIFGWITFNRRVLWSRFYFPDSFIQHIEKLCRSQSSLPQEHRNQKLIIECGYTKLNGIGLELLLRSASMPDGNSAQTMSNVLLPGFDELYKRSPYLNRLEDSNSLLPNLKLNIEHDTERSVTDVQIWDIETCLENAEQRQHLLNLIMEIKSLTLAGQFNRFKIFTGFHSLQRVKIKDSLSTEQGSSLEHAEYLSWAECLMDFNVKVPDAFEEGLDKQLLRQEISAFPELRFLSGDESAYETNNASEDMLWKGRKDDDTESRWNTIKYILLHAEDLYRFKWESCSNAEKLALFSLAKKRKLNPFNTQMIEHLALNGLIKATRGHLKITNNSFAHFVVNAETTDTLNHMVRRSQDGVWKSYRMPLGFLVVLVIGGIALTSGESIYIIAASVAGVLTTIAGVANSAHLLRGQIRE